jgi:hypothetical protein
VAKKRERRSWGSAAVRVFGDLMGQQILFRKIKMIMVLAFGIEGIPARWTAILALQVFVDGQLRPTRAA